MSVFYLVELKRAVLPEKLKGYPGGRLGLVNMLSASRKGFGPGTPLSEYRCIRSVKAAVHTADLGPISGAIAKPVHYALSNIIIIHHGDNDKVPVKASKAQS